MTLADRIREAMGTMSPAELARRTGKTPATVSQWLGGIISSLKGDSAAAIERATGYRASWLATGAGPKLAATETPPAYGNAIELENNDDYPAIRRVAFTISAGAGGFGIEYRDDDGPPIVFQRAWFETRGYRPDKLFAIKVRNGSMEPGLYEGDTVVVNTDSITPKDGVVFACNFEGELVIKRVTRNAGQWWLSSDNPDQRRYSAKLCDENVFMVGEIVHKQSERI